MGQIALSLLLFLRVFDLAVLWTCTVSFRGERGRDRDRHTERDRHTQIYIHTCQRVSNFFPSGMESFPVLSLSMR